MQDHGDVQSLGEVGRRVAVLQDWHTLGTGQATKADEFSEKRPLTTPHPLFSESYVAIFIWKMSKSSPM